MMLSTALPAMAQASKGRANLAYSTGLSDSTILNLSRTLSMVPGAGPGWQTLSEADKAFSSGDYKTALHRIMQAQARFEKDQDEAGVCVTLLKAGNLYQHWKVYERALTYYHDAEELARKLHMPMAFMQDIWTKQAACAQMTHQATEAATAYRSLLESYQEQGNREGVRLVLLRLAELFQQQGEYDEALATFRQLAVQEEKGQNTLRQAMAYNNIGYSLQRMGRHEDALVYFEKALNGYGTAPINSVQRVATLINMGSSYNQLRQYESAMHVLEQALLEPAAHDEKNTEADLRNFLAVTFLNMGAYDKGLRAVDKAIMAGRDGATRDVLVRCYRTKAKLCDNVLNYAEGSRYHQMYADLKDSIHYEERLKEQSALLRDLNVERLEKELRLLITDTEKNQLVLRQGALEAEREIRQKELLLLQREKEVQDYTNKTQALELERANIRKRELEGQNAMRISELERKEAEIKMGIYRKRLDEKAHKATVRLLAKDKILLEQTRRSQQLRIKDQREREKLMFGFIMLAVIAVAGAYVGLSKVKTANLKLRVQQDEVMQQKESTERMFQLLEVKNRNITDSIKYARRIQSVVVPGIETLSHYLPLSFVLLRPRDVVSGDIFYLHRSERYTFLASIDCTGHGVPGAMLSVLGYQTLNHIVSAGKLIQPSAILHALDNDMAELLRADQSDLQQGMDIGLVVIDRQERRLHFSGAVHCLSYFANGQMQEVKSSRCSIGGLVPRADKVYHTTTLSITDHMQCFLASDGIPTQIGGPDGKKFGSKRLRALYETIMPMSAAAKKNQIEQEIDRWMGTEYKQLDDMLVIGFRPDLAV